MSIMCLLYLVGMMSGNRESDIPQMVTDGRSNEKVVDTGPREGGELFFISIDIH